MHCFRDEGDKCIRLFTWDNWVSNGFQSSKDIKRRAEDMKEGAFSLRLFQ